MTSTKRFVLAIMISLGIILGFIWGLPLIKSGPPTSPAAMTAKKMFDLWQHQQFAEIIEVVYGEGDTAEFVVDMAKSPVHFRNLHLDSEKKRGNDWLIGLTIETTDIASIFASVVNSEYMRNSTGVTTASFIMPPSELKIERFQTVRQEIIVTCSDTDKCRVNLCRDPKNPTCVKNQNIMNYALDAGTVIRDSDEIEIRLLQIDESKTASAERVAVWLKRVMFDLDLSETHLAQITTDGMELFKTTPLGKIQVMQEQMRKIQRGQLVQPTQTEE